MTFIFSLTSFFLLVLYWEWTGACLSNLPHWLKFIRVSNLMFYLFVERDSDWWCSPIWCGHQWWEFADCQKALWNGRTAYAYQSKFHRSPYWNSLMVCGLHLFFNFFYFCILQISLLSPHEREDILLPVSMKTIKDLHVSPYDRFILLASLGKKLSVLRLITSPNFLLNNCCITVKYTLLDWKFSVLVSVLCSPPGKYLIYLFSFFLQFWKQPYCSDIWLTGNKSRPSFYSCPFAFTY